MTGPDPLVRIPTRQKPNNNLVDERPMDEDERLDFADQEPLPLVTIPYTLIVPDVVYDIILRQHTAWASSTHA
jgi:hypothetical protein